MSLFGSSNPVPFSNELFRIQDLPRRVWEPKEAEQLARRLTRKLRQPGSKMELRPLQAVALAELAAGGAGLFAPIRVGAGKTLISLLAPAVKKAQRPLLLVPASLRGKTRREMEILKYHFRISEEGSKLGAYKIMGYEWLGREQAAEALDEYEPDLIVADEGHRLKNTGAGVTRRVVRYLRAHPETSFLVMSGTITKRSLMDYWHLIRRALGDDMCPLPTDYRDIEIWADALDKKKHLWEMADPGALKVFCNVEEKKLWKRNSQKAARQAFRRRLTETPCVVASHETAIDASLRIFGVEPKVSRATEEAFDLLRSAWETPDGWPIDDALSMHRHARELALGFYYVWDPRPPESWLEARRKWSAFVRQVLRHSRKLDTELQVRRQNKHTEEWQEWAAIRHSFKPNSYAVWIDDSVVEYIAKWAQRYKGIIWVEHRELGFRLERDFGFDYYKDEGLNRKKQMIEDHDPRKPLVASVESNKTGRNLQAWNRNLITSAPTNGLAWEQLIGRTHRDGQEADEVTFDVLITCAEHAGAVANALTDSEYTEDTTGSPQKLLLADIDVPSATKIALRKGARWTQKGK